MCIILTKFILLMIFNSITFDTLCNFSAQTMLIVDTKNKICPLHFEKYETFQEVFLSEILVANVIQMVLWGLIDYIYLQLRQGSRKYTKLLSHKSEQQMLKIPHSWIVIYTQTPSVKLSLWKNQKSSLLCSPVRARCPVKLFKVSSRCRLKW